MLWKNFSLFRNSTFRPFTLLTYSGLLLLLITMNVQKDIPPSHTIRSKNNTQLLFPNCYKKNYDSLLLWYTANWSDWQMYKHRLPVLFLRKQEACVNQMLILRSQMECMLRNLCKTGWRKAGPNKTFFFFFLNETTMWSLFEYHIYSVCTFRLHLNANKVAS